MLIALMAREMKLSEDFLRLLAQTASMRYHHFQIAKKTGGARDIYHPARELKAVQRWLAGSVIARLPVHDAATAYRKGRNIADNARLHVASRFLVRLDFRNFFESLRAEDIRNYCATHGHLFPAWWSNSDTETLQAFLCRNGRITIGAVTSPSISNALCYTLDEKLSSIAHEVGAIYSRYADDVFISTARPHLLRGLVRRARDTVAHLSCPGRLRFNESKTKHSSRKHRRVVTGVILATDGRISLGRAAKRRLQIDVFRAGRMDEVQFRRLAGMLGHAKGVEPEFLTRIITRYGAERIQRILKGQWKELQLGDALGSAPARAG